MFCAVRSSRPNPRPLVRGSSRRIMTMRFRPADIRVINRRKLPLAPSPALRPHLPAPIPRKETKTVKTGT